MFYHLYPVLPNLYLITPGTCLLDLRRPAAVAGADGVRGEPAVPADGRLLRPGQRLPRRLRQDVLPARRRGEAARDQVGDGGTGSGNAGVPTFEATYVHSITELMNL